MTPRVFLPAVLSGVLLWAGFFPLDLGPVAFVAIVPWLTLVRAPASARRRYFAAYVGGVAFFGVALNWLPVAHPMMYFSWAALSLVCALFWVAGLFILRRIDRSLPVPLAFSVPVVWVALEYLRAHFPVGFSFLAAVGLHHKIGFAWYFLGYTQHAFLPLVQVADLGGVYAVSFLVAATNGLAADWVLRSAAVGRWLRWPVAEAVAPRPVWATAAVGVLVVAAVGYGYARLDHPAFAAGPRVAALQGSVPQLDKDYGPDKLWETYSALHVQARQRPTPDLIVWPETSYPHEWYDVAPGVALETTPADFQKDYRLSRRALLRNQWGTSVLLGVSANEWEGGKSWRYNSALALGSGGEYLGRYDKMHLVPFGEYVPLRGTLPWMSMFSPYDWDYSCRPGEHWTRFPLTAIDGRAFAFGCLICYESSDPYLARQYAGPVEPVDFLVNISNDGWFNGTEEHEQHLAIGRFRAVETRRSVVRAVNMGISCVIDPDGRVGALPGETWAKSKKVSAVVSAVVPIDTRITWYARVGDWLPAACWGLLVVGHVAAVVRKRRGAA